MHGSDVDVERRSLVTRERLGAVPVRIGVHVDGDWAILRSFGVALCAARALRARCIVCILRIS